MITANKILHLTEEYFQTKNVSGKEVVIYCNPTGDEIKSLHTDSVRFIADAINKKVYIWDANFAIHENIWPVIFGSPRSIREYFPHVLTGECKVSGNTLTYFDWEEFSIFKKFFPNSRLRDGSTTMEVSKTFFNKVLFKYNWSWLSKYISNIDSFISKCQMEYTALIK